MNVLTVLTAGVSSFVVLLCCKSLLKKRYAILCPFHKENTPSCTIDIKSNTFHCFGCGANGKIKLLSENNYDD